MTVATRTTRAAAATSNGQGQGQGQGQDGGSNSSSRSNADESMTTVEGQNITHDSDMSIAVGPAAAAALRRRSRLSSATATATAAAAATTSTVSSDVTTATTTMAGSSASPAFEWVDESQLPVLNGLPGRGRTLAGSRGRYNRYLPAGRPAQLLEESTVPAPAPASAVPSRRGRRPSSSNTLAAARSVSGSRSRRAATVEGENGQQQEDSNSMDVDIIANTSTQSSSSTSTTDTTSLVPSHIIDSLPDVPFPKRGVKLSPMDASDPLLLLIGKVLASVKNRALSPKEMGIVLARKHNWQPNGSLPSIAISACIRAHLRRAAQANPPYPPIFSSYELGNHLPVEDIQSLGIEVDARPLIKRGTFWYLADAMGYGNPFPHHAPPPQALPLSQQQQQQQLQSSMTPTPIAPAPASTTTTSTSTRGHLRSSSRHSSLLQQQQSAWSTHSPSSFAGTTAHPIPLAPAPGPAAGPSSPSQQQKPTNDNKVTTKLSKRRESDRLTRAQASNQSTPSASALSTGTVTATATATPSTSTSSGEMQALPQQALPPHLQPAASSAATSSSSSSSTTTTTTEPVAPAVSVEEVPAQAQADPLGRGKRKRPISIARRQSQQYQQQQILPAVIAPAPAPAVAETAGREQQGVSMSEIPVNQSNATATATATAASTTAVATGATADNRKTRTSHRRAFSSSASDAAVQRPIPALRKLKFRLSSVNESASSNSTAPAPAAGAASTTSTSSSHFSVTLPASASANGAPGSSNNKSGTLKSSKSGNNTKQPKSKRQRTQSMSHHTNTTSTFPFNDLRSHLSMQTSLHDATLSNHHHHQHLHPQQHSGALNHDGTLFPLEMHVHHLLSSPGGGLGLNGQHQHVLDLLTSRSAPESNIFSPSSVRNAASGFSFVAGPFSRSHSPSVSLGHSGRRSLPPLENGSGGANANANASSQLQRGEEERDGIDFDGWGGLDDLISGGSSLLNIPLGSSAPASTDFHEAMLKNDIDFAFDFSLDSLNQSSNRLGGGGGGDSEAHHDDHHHEEDDIAEDEASAGEQTRAGSGRSSRQGTAGTRSASVLDRDTRSSSSSFATANEIDGVFDGVDDVDDSRETVKDSSQRRRSSTVKAATRTFAEGDEDSNGSADADHAAADDMVEDQREGEEETANLQSHGNSANNSVNALDDHTLEWAMNTTLCPAAARLVDGQKPSRLLLKRLTSASGLAFPRLSHQQMAHRADTNGPLTPLLRPATISRTNSRDVLTTPVPLAELPSIPLENSHKDSFLFYHLTSEADPPGSPLAGDNSNTHKESERSKTEEDDFDRASASSSASSSSSLLTPVVKAEEDMDEMAEMEESTGDGSSRPQLSRSCSTASGLTAVEAESNDSFNAEMIYRIGGQEEMEQLRGREQILSRSQSSSRTTSLSPRDSFSPQIIGPHEVDADWALTPPSEEEHVDEEEKDLDRATMLGLESVGMDDLDDVWPGARRSMDIQQQVDGVTTDLKVLEVFEPVLSAAPLPASEMPVPAPIVASNNRRDEDSADSDETSMQVDLTPMDEHTAATMFIADESLHPPRPSVEAAPDLPTESQQEQQQDQSQRPSLSPVSAATEQVTQVAVNTTTTDTSTGTPNSMTTVTVPSTSSPEHALPQPVEPSTQSFLFNPEKPFYPEIAILLTETKILFYSTVHYCVNNGRPLLRRVENDAVDAEALLIALEGSAGDAEAGRLEALDKIRQLSNTWVSLEFARDLLGKYGGVDHPLATFLADDIILSWNEKLVKLGTMLRQKNGLRTPVNKPSYGTTPKTKKTIASKSGSKERPTEAPAESPAATSEAATELESRAESPRQSSVSPSKQQAKQESESLSPVLAKRNLVAKPSKAERAEATKDKISSATASPEPLRAHTFSKSKKHVEVVIEGNASIKKDKNSVAAAMTAAAAAKGVPAARRSSSRHKSITT